MSIATRIAAVVEVFIDWTSFRGPLWKPSESIVANTAGPARIARRRPHVAEKDEPHSTMKTDELSVFHHHVIELAKARGIPFAAVS